MNIFLIGGGGREDALAWKLKQSQQCSKLYCAPGNAGIAQKAEIADIKAEDIDALVDFAINNNIDLVMVGPEAPLVDGIADRLQAHNIPVFGPTKAAAQLEGSKGFMKDLCARHGVPTCAYQRFTNISDAKDYIKTQNIPLVIKADGLAAGKGVIIAQSMDEALSTAEDMLSGNSFGEAGSSIVVEEFLDGEELSYFALCDGNDFIPFGSAQDHKRAFDGDEGPNTGGMGCYSPAHLMTDELEQKILTRIIEPTIKGMAAENMPFTGVLFAGIMVVNNEPYLIEFNTRFGDPECQSLMMRLDYDLVDILKHGANGTLKDIKDDIRWQNQTALCVVMAAKGYPGAYDKGSIIGNLDTANALENVTILHAGTSVKDGKIIATGGRVLGVNALGNSVAEAQSRAYEAADLIDWPQGFCRRDIGWRAVAAEDQEIQKETGTSSISC
jgi:phosphoribosylamine--glycine ligase